MELEVNYVKSCKNKVVICLETQKVTVYTNKAITDDFKRYVKSRMPGYTLIEKR